MNQSAVADVDNATLEALVSPLMTVVVPVIYISVFVISTPCNVIAFFLLCGFTKRATPTVIYSINLCLADLLCSITLPLQVDYHFRGNDWRFGSVICGISTAAFYCNMHCSILTTCAIALERYCGVVRPLNTRHLRSTRKAIFICLLIWGVVFTFQTPYFLHDFTRTVPQLGITTCFDVLPKGVFKGVKGYLYFTSIYLLFYVIPLVVLVICHFRVAHALTKTVDAGLRRSRKRTQAVVIVAAVCFLVCYLPNMIVQPIHMVYRKNNHSLYAYYKLTLGLNSLNCCFDPFVYYFASRELRQAFWRFCCRPDREEPFSGNLSEIPSGTRGISSNSS
ncbi:P2Y purinoceptor 8-like [Trichomycterus rosablanca]|uniref:P2Y purinoceptor 8-like n=1 Tax=Trichomycterus rosablanca TaxID=2290929 RepID=UPI002F360C86